ncbi:MAG: hypothetical protein ABFE02_07600 [Sulfuricella sp.]
MKLDHLVGTAVLALCCALPALAEPPAASGHQHFGRPGDALAKPDSGRHRGQEWTRYPLITPAMKGGNPERMAGSLALKNIDATQLTVYAPAGQTSKDFAVEEQGARIEAVDPKIGNFHWVAARQDKERTVTVASTVYAFSNPGPAPTAMFLQQKNALEIIPQPLPREHSSYRESEKWRFLVRFNGQPLAGKKLNMETEFGTRTSFITGADGQATVLFPLDFKPTLESASGSHGPRRAKFVLAAEHDDLGKHYLTAFNYGYGADPDRNRSLAAGAGFGLLGMLLAAPLWRRRRDNKENQQ